MTLRSRDFESRVSASSTTAAGLRWTPFFGALLRCSLRCSLAVPAGTGRFAPQSRLVLHSNKVVYLVCAGFASNHCHLYCFLETASTFRRQRRCALKLLQYTAQNGVVKRGWGHVHCEVSMAYIVAVVNQKGGVGKTTTAVNLAAYLANKGKFILLVDLDPQANASSGLGIDHRAIEAGVYEAIIGEVGLREVIKPTKIAGLKVAPATAALAGAAVELVPMERREYRLYDALLEVRNDYDYIFIDCPPTLGLHTLNGIVAADRVLIPVQAEYYALEGLSQLLETIGMVKASLKPELEIMGAVITMFDGRTKLSDDVMKELQRFFPNRIFQSVIPRNVRLAEAPSFGQVISEYDQYSKGAKAYEQLADEVLALEMAVEPVAIAQPS